jgi:RNA polymerase sigma-70 factor, ECF subfamily
MVMNAACSALLGSLDLFGLQIFALAGTRSEDSSERRRADSEASLIRRANQGDRQAFDELFRQHVDEVYRRITRLIGPDPEREDLVQEVFLAAFRGLHGFRGEASFSTWIYRIVVHIAYSHLRRRRPALPQEKASEAIEQLVEESLSVEAATAQRQQVQQALELLSQIKPKKRMAFVLRVVEGLSLQEIGEIVEATPAAVGQRVVHAQRELQRIIEREQRRKNKGATT